MHKRINLGDLELRHGKHPSGGWHVPEIDSDQSGMAVQAAGEAAWLSRTLDITGGGTSVGNPGKASLVGVYPSRGFMDWRSANTSRFVTIFQDHVNT